MGRVSGARATAAALAACLAGVATASAPPAAVDGGSEAASRPAVDLSVAASRLSSAGGASEYWDLVARFESGHRLFARFLLTNEGPGERTAVATGHLVQPDGRATPFQNGRREGRWTLGPDGLRIRIGSSVLDQSRPLRHFEVDNNKRRIKLFLDFPSDALRPRASRAVADGYAVELLDLATPVAASLHVDGMPAPVETRGHLALTHTWMNESESKLALRRIEFASLQSGIGVYVSDLTAPSGVRTRWLSVERDGEILYRSADFDLALEGSPEGHTGLDGYPVPGRMRMSGESLRGEITVGPVLLARDPFEALPSAFRLLLSFRSRPQRVWADAQFAITLPAGPGRSPLLVQGSGVTAVTFLNPLPSRPGVSS